MDRSTIFKIARNRQIFVFATVTIPSYAAYAGGSIPVVILVALFVTLIPTTIGALLSAIGIAGMDRLVRFNVLAMSGRAVEAAGDVDTLLLDKTGTITLGNRQATTFRPVRGVSEQELADAAQLASLADETPEGRSIVVLAKEKYGIRGRDMKELGATFVPFTAQTRMSGIDTGSSWVRKGAVDAVLAYLGAAQPVASGNVARVLQPAFASDTARDLQAISDEIAKSGGTPLAVARDGRLLGVIELKDIIKGGMPISGLFDLRPFRHSWLQPKIQLDHDLIERQSPLFHIPDQGPPLTVRHYRADASRFSGSPCPPEQ